MADVSGWVTRLVPAADIPTPASGKMHLFFDVADDMPKYKDDTGTVLTFPSVATFNGRSGIVTPLQADYDSFFLTPAEGNAAYQPLDSDLTSIAALSTTSYGRSQLTLADATADTAQLNVATASLKGLQSAADKKKEDAIWFDIVADGGADPTGVVDIATILTNAIAGISSTVGGVIYFPTGIYKLSSAITVDKEVIFKGNGRNNTFIELSSATANGFNLTTNYIGFENLRIWTTGGSSTLRTAGAAINMDNGSAFPSNIHNCYVKDCDILFQWTAIILGAHLSWIDNCNIRECGANASNGAGVLIQKFGDRYLNRVTTDNPTNPTGFAWIRVTEGSSLVVTNCNLIHGTNCLDLVPAAGKAIPSVWCSNTFFDTSVIGVNFAGDVTGTIHRVKFTQCWFSTMTNSGAVLNQVNLTGLDFIGCDFYDNTSFGIQALAATDWSVRASRFAGNDVAAIRTTAAAAHSFTISDCFIGNSAGFGANAIGIDILAGTYKRYQILDNRGLESNTTAGIIDLGVVAAADQKNVTNNMGALITGSQGLVSSGGAAVINARGAVTSGTAETYLFGTRIPANAVAVGQTFRFSCYGQTSGAGTLIFRLRAGPVGTVAAAEAVLVLTTTTVGQVANAWQKFEGVATIVALGPTGTVAGSGWVVAGILNLGMAAVAEVIGNVPTTAPWFLYVTCACGGAGTFTVREGVIEAI